MIDSIFKFLLFVGIFSFASVLCVAQTPGNRDEQKEDLPKNIKESLIKSRIEQEKKDHEELLQKAEEATKLSAELQEAYEKNKTLSAEDKKKLERLEKLLKKIRKDLGGGDDNDDSKDNSDNSTETEKPSNVVTALSKLRSTSVGLFDELKKTSRFSISVVAIQSSNAILKVIRFLRFNN
ncbi:MAG: hypothetical protein LUM44_13130 [Pyrinomonadaceae bacterium]|nr:hypothetical protein [Pyrinomonadaceae bacterium]